jgi:hypothetical protein
MFNGLVILLSQMKDVHLIIRQMILQIFSIRVIWLISDIDITSRISYDGLGENGVRPDSFGRPKVSYMSGPHPQPNAHCTTIRAASP